MKEKGVYTATFAMVALVLIFSSIILMSVSVREIEFESKVDAIYELEFVTENTLYLLDQAASDAIADQLVYDYSGDRCDPAPGGVRKNFEPKIKNYFSNVFNEVKAQTGFDCELEGDTFYEWGSGPTTNIYLQCPSCPANPTFFVYTIKCSADVGGEVISVSKTSGSTKWYRDGSWDASDNCIAVDIFDQFSQRCDVDEVGGGGCVP